MRGIVGVPQDALTANLGEPIVNRYAVCFRWVVVLGILVNLFFALPGIFIPNAVLDFAGVEPAYNQIWPAFACFLLMLLSLFYIPAAINLFRYTPIAWLSVVARFAGVVFFFVLWRGYPLFGTIDLVFGVVQLVFLVLALRRGPDADY
jgi:hypothetical protein